MNSLEQYRWCTQFGIANCYNIVTGGIALIGAYAQQIEYTGDFGPYLVPQTGLTTTIPLHGSRAPHDKKLEAPFFAVIEPVSAELPARAVSGLLEMEVAPAATEVRGMWIPGTKFPTYSRVSWTTMRSARPSVRSEPGLGRNGFFGARRLPCYSPPDTEPGTPL